MGFVVRLDNNGDSILLSDVLPKDFLKNAGSSGFGVAPTTLNMKRLATVGSRFQRSRREARDIDLPITIFGSDAQSIERKMRRLIRLLNDSVSSPILYAIYPDDTAFCLEVHYVAGADVQFGVTTNKRQYARWPLTLRAPDPYWKAVDSSGFTLTLGTPPAAFIGSLSRMPLASSQAIGAFTLDNDGDVDSYPVWTIKGPADSFTATRQSDGVSFTYTAAIASGDTITIDTETKRVYDQNGVNKYDKMGAAPKLFSILPGSTVINVTLPGATTASSVAFEFQPRRELVFG